MELRHAPRREKGSTAKIGAPCTPAAIPNHWRGRTTAAGDREKPPPKDDIPDFSTWKRERRKEVRVTGARRAGETPVPVMSAVPMTPGLMPLGGASAGAAPRHYAGSAGAAASSSSAMAPAVKAQDM